MSLIVIPNVFSTLSNTPEDTNLLFDIIFVENYMKMKKKIWNDRGLASFTPLDP